MTRTLRHRPRLARIRFLLTSLATLLALTDLAVAGPPGEGGAAATATGFATTDATDPYLWLEEIDGTRALDWVRAQNAATERKLATQPLYQELRREALAALDSPSRLPDVNQMGKWIYNFWKDDQHPRGIYRRATLEELRKPNPAWEVVLDVDDLARREGKPWVFHGMDCLPPEYKECLVSLSPGGGDAEEIREFDPETLAFEPQGFSLPTAKTTVAWRDADSLFVGTRLRTWIAHHFGLSAQRPALEARHAARQRTDPFRGEAGIGGRVRLPPALRGRRRGFDRRQSHLL